MSKRITLSVSGEDTNEAQRAFTTASASLLDELGTPLEVTVNVLYLVRAAGYDLEGQARLIEVAKGKLQEIVAIVKCHKRAA